LDIGVFIALGPGALTMTLFSYSVPRLARRASRSSPMSSLVTVVAIGILVLGEAVTRAGDRGGLIVAGILTTPWRAGRRCKPPPFHAPVELAPQVPPSPAGGGGLGWGSLESAYPPSTGCAGTYCRMPPWRKYRARPSVSMRADDGSSRTPPQASWIAQDQAPCGVEPSATR